MVLPDSHRVSRVPWYLGVLPRSPIPFAYRAFTFYGWPFQAIRLETGFVTPSQGLQPPHARSHNPHDATPAGYIRAMGLGSFPFARRYLGNHYCFLLLRVLRCFSSPGALLIPISIGMGDPTLLGSGYPIRKSPDQSLFAAPRSVSPLTASFIGPLPQGIHRTPFLA